MCHDDDATVAPLYLNILSTGGAADYWSSALGAYKRGVKRHNGRPVYTQVADSGTGERPWYLWWSGEDTKTRWIKERQSGLKIKEKTWCVSYDVGGNDVFCAATSRDHPTTSSSWQFKMFGRWQMQVDPYYFDQSWGHSPCRCDDPSLRVEAMTELPCACSITLSCDTLLPQDMAHPEVLGR